MVAQERMTVFQKTLLISIAGTFIALACLTASLPIPYPSHQQPWTTDSKISGTYPDGYDTGSTTWMMVCTIMGFFMAPAMVKLYSNLYKLDDDFVKLCVIMGAMICFLWVIFSFSLSYGQDANGHQIMGFPKTYYMFWWTGANSAEQNGADTIPNSIFAVFELCFALVTPCIVAASVYGRVNVTAFLIFIFCWHLVIYTPITHITWFPTGWFKTHIIEDFAGGIVVHQLSAITALALHITLGREKTPKATAVSASMLPKLFPALFSVWFCWFGMTAGKAHSASPVATQAIVNCIASSTTAVLMSWLYDLVFDLNTSTVSIVMAVMMGLISISPAAGYVTVGGAMLIAIFTVLVTRLVARNHFGEGINENEPYSLLTLHGLSGTLGFFATAVFSYTMVNPDAFNGLDYGRGIPLSHHISAILALWSALLIAVILLAFLVNQFFPLAIDNSAYESAPKNATSSGDVESSAVTPNDEAKQIELSVV